MTSKNAYLTTVGRREVQGVSCRVVDGGVSSCTIQPSVPRVFSTCVSTPRFRAEQQAQERRRQGRDEPSTNIPDRHPKRDRREQRPPPPSSPEEYAKLSKEYFKKRSTDGKLTFDSTRRPPANSAQYAIFLSFVNVV